MLLTAAPQRLGERTMLIRFDSEKNLQIWTEYIGSILPAILKLLGVQYCENIFTCLIIILTLLVQGMPIAGSQ